MRTIRWGIIGAGDVTEIKSGPAFQQARHSQLVAVMRRDAARARDYAQRHGVPRWTDDADALIHDPEVDAVYIATPPHVHMAYTLRVAQAGKPVYVEKPMARTYDECQAMIDACRAAGVPLFVAYYRRALPRFLKIKALIDEGAIGTVRSVAIALHQPPAPAELDPANLPWRVVPEIAGGGKFVDLASHMLDFLDYVLGPIRQAQGFASNQAGLYAAEDIVSGSFVFDSGAQGVGTWCFSSGQALDRIEIAGTEGQIAFACFDTSPITITAGGQTATYQIDNPPHVQGPLIQMVVDALNGSGACPSTGESAARTNWVMDQMLAGYRSARRPA
ncbi:MAG: Gfo/Idh/MocA family oxidoreductase [Chloroflexi bacterium]|nr:Gfo/Idh/MocA family oxidoreductase [Chloroflexota bacterium]